MVESEGTATMAALEKSLELFGEQSKRVLLSHGRKVWHRRQARGHF